MKWRNTVVLSVTFAAMFGCAGSLDNPDQFEQASNAATGGDAGTSPANDDAGGGGPVVSDCDGPALVTAKCATGAGCHTADAPGGGLDLVSAGVAERVLDKKGSAGACETYTLLDSADAAQSLIYTKVTEAPPCGSRMPLGGTLTADEQACLLTWLQSL